MCFGGGSMPKVKTDYVKPDYKLPSLSMNPVQRVDPQYKEVMAGGKVRSLLMPTEIINGMING
jgi:hypothetical protein